MCYEYGMGVKKDSTEAVNWYRKAAEQGDADAQFNLGVCYEYGYGITQDSTEAVNWYRKAAEQGNADAQYNLGTCYQEGIGVDQNNTKAMNWFRKAVEQGNKMIINKIVDYYGEKLDPSSLHKTGKIIDSLKYYHKEILKWLSKAVELNDPEAMTKMGWFYLCNKTFKVFCLCDKSMNMDSLKSNNKKAIEWYTKAAELKNVNAQRRLAICYRYGMYGCIEPDIQIAIKWFTEAANQNDTRSMESLANIYYSQNNEKESFKWLEKIDEYNHSNHALEMGKRFYYGVSNWEVNHNYEKAIYWYSIAAESGNNEAICELANCYSDGKGVQKDVNKALELYKKAASNGYGFACVSIGGLFKYGDLGPNYEEALKWYKKAVEMGEDYAQEYVTEMEDKINGIEQNEKKFLEKIISGEEVGGTFGIAYKCALAGDPTGQALLGEFYYIGFRVKQNFSEAIKWFTTVLQNADDSTSSIMNKIAYSSAFYNLGRCYYFGHGFEQNYTKAFEYFKKAAEDGYPQAQNNVGMCYYHGTGVVRNVTEAKKWIQKAADQNLDEARENLKLIESGNSELKFVDFGEAKITF